MSTFSRGRSSCGQQKRYVYIIPCMQTILHTSMYGVTYVPKLELLCQAVVKNVDCGDCVLRS